jgi:riboflavin biosynthesis pyrimidine reductase
MLAPFERLYAAPLAAAAPLPLPTALAQLYGELGFPRHPGRPYAIGNFVATLDGVVSLGLPGKAGGGDISGFNRHDRALMGLLRAAAAAVVVGAGTFRSVPKHVWTAEHVFPDLSAAFYELRHTLGLGRTPLNVILSASGRLDLSAPVFASGNVDVLILTTPLGASRLPASALPPKVAVRVSKDPDHDGLTAAAVMAEIVDCLGDPAPLVLVEGGPQVMGGFFTEQRLDELFLTVAPQVAGRSAGAGAAARPGLVSGRVFAPDHPVWGELLGVHRAESHLFLRYRFPPA